MVLNNDDAKQRVTPGYKPNMAFHKRKEYHNSNNDYFNTIRAIVKIIREKYDANVPIIFVTFLH